MTITHQDIIDYWFSAAVLAKCFGKDPEFDQEIRERYFSVYEQAIAGELSGWRKDALGRLAEIIVLDQFSRNMFRDKPEAFAYDNMARERAREVIACGADREYTSTQKAFAYMPLMHSESAADHELAMKLYSGDPALASSLGYEIRHKAIIDRFGRYPHRNEVLERESTAEELEFLNQPGSSF